MEVSVDRDWRHERVLDIKRRPLSNERPESGGFTSVEFVRLEASLFQEFYSLDLVLPRVEVLVGR